MFLIFVCILQINSYFTLYQCIFYIQSKPFISAFNGLLYGIVIETIWLQMVLFSDVTPFSLIIGEVLNRESSLKQNDSLSSLTYLKLFYNSRRRTKISLSFRSRTVLFCVTEGPWMLLLVSDSQIEFRLLTQRCTNL